MKKGFIKFGHEDIRTDYKACDTSHIAPDAIKLSGTVIKFNDTSKKAVDASDSDLMNADNINNGVYVLAEDFKPNDNGFVYYIVENVANLEDRA